jgi:hypothetical protein
MKVLAAPGTRCPMEGNPRKYIGDAEPAEVPESAYYKRLVGDGSLIMPYVSPVKKKEVKADGQ